MLKADVDADVDVFKVAFVNTTAVYNSAHEFWSSLESKLVGTPQTLSDVTITNGVFDAANAIFPAVTGSNISALVIFKSTGSSATSLLLVWIDTLEDGPISIAPSGGDIAVTWDNGASKIFAL